MSVTITPLGNGAEGIFLQDTRFSTTLISFNFCMPLKREKAAAYALLPFLLTTCGRDYPDFSRLNYKLNKLYGAQLGAAVEKAGDLQLLKISVSVINDRFALDGEPLTSMACELLMNLIFEPRVENDMFFTEDVEREKRKAIEHIRGEISEKRVYAGNRLIEEMYRDEAYGTPKCGTEEEVRALTGETLYAAWREMLACALVRVNVVSPALPPALFDTVRDRFAAVSRREITDRGATIPTTAAAEVRTVTERMDVSQGKLVMGFSSECRGCDRETTALLVATDIFGGGPYSRLFTNVREKMSLCYYCSASSVRVKGLVTVSSGVEEQNIDRAQQEIEGQLGIVQRGEFSDFEFESSRKSLTDTLRSAGDSQAALDAWYSTKIFDREPLAPEELAELVSAVGREDVLKAARGLKLHTVYRLLPKEDANA